MERDRLKEDNRSYIKAFIISKNQAFEKLNETLKFKGDKNYQSVSEELKIIKAKYGAAGS